MKLLLLILAIALTAFTNVSRADVRLSDLSDNLCDIQIEGEIQNGDAQRFREYAELLIGQAEAEHQQRPEAVQADWPFTVCLDSVGGSYVEGIQLALAVQGYFETRLLDGAECYSACAFVFMSGSADSAWRLFARPSPEEAPYGYSTRPMRTMSPSSRLGFHAPYVNFEGRDTVSVGEAEAAISGVLALTGFLLTETQENFPLELAQQALRRGPDELYFVEEVGQLNAWSIGLASNYRPPLTFETFRTAWITFAHRYANGTPGYGSVGDPAFGVMEDSPSLWGTSGWDYNTSQGTTESGAPYLLAANVGNEASFGAAFIDYGDFFQLRVLTPDFSTEIARYDILGWQLVDPATRIDELQ